MTFQEFLRHSEQDRGVLAALRQGLTPSREMLAWPYLAQFGGIGDSMRARTVRTVAGLFAHHPSNCKKGNMGTTCLTLCLRRGGEKPWELMDFRRNRAIPLGPVARRFCWMLEADREEICERVIRMVLFAKNERIPVNYAQLEEDLTHWPRAREYWARSFWTTEKTAMEIKE